MDNLGERIMLDERVQRSIAGCQWSMAGLGLMVLGGAVALLLAGCATPAIEAQVVEVEVPVAVQPVKPEQVPALPAPLPKRPATLAGAADLLMSKWCEAVSYFIRAKPLLDVSSGQQPGEAPRYPECEK